jgi:arylsulfatase A-like enzyme
LAAAETAVRPPNVVLIMMDDQGARDAGYAGSRYYETPRMDRLAGEGMRFSQAYSCGPNCAPTRASLMSGQYGPRTGVYTVDRSDRGPMAQARLVPVENRTVLDTAVVTWPEQLRQAGYATCLVGKWHLGGSPATLPTGQGFDLNVGGGEAGSTRSYFSPYGNPALSDGPVGEYLTDRLAEEAVRFLRSHADRPFCLYFSQFAVHTPIQPKKELIARFATKATDGEQRNPRYAALLYSADQAVGRILDELDALHLSDRTVVMMTSDNGGVQGLTGQAPLRGYKGMLYEGGIRVPLVVRWPGHVKPGSTCDEPVATVDVYPTVLALTGAPAPASVLDGADLSPLLQGAAKLPREALFWHFPCYLDRIGNDDPHPQEARKSADEPEDRGGDAFRTRPCGAIRQGPMKLIEFFEDGRLELYDLAKDPGETRNLAKDMPEAAASLLARLRAWRDRIGAPMPKPRKPASGAGSGG